MEKKKFTYKDAGVDIEAGEEMVDSIKDLVKETHDERVLANIGGFGGLYAPDIGKYKEPVLVSSIDGVGTKLIVAFQSKTFHTVGRDLVNHCVNDIAVCGATPLFFLDYFSTGKLKKETAYEIIQGFSKACKENRVALIGGETAEMPDIYKDGEFDLAGTIVGIVDKHEIITGKKIRKGHKLIALPSTGLHTNGYSLARKVLFSNFDLDDQPEELDQTVGETMLAVHKSYLSEISVLKKLEGVHGFSHITGGGIEGNTKRILPDGLSLSVNWNSWKRPPVFNLIQKTGLVPEEDMRKTFNLGAGLVIVADPGIEKEVFSKLEEMGTGAFTIGMVV